APPEQHDKFAREPYRRVGRTGENGSRSQDGSRPDQCPFVNTAVSADQDIVFNYDRGSIDRLQHSSDLGSSAQMNTLADLRTGAYQGVRIDHGAFVNVCTNVDEHRRHTD